MIHFNPPTDFCFKTESNPELFYSTNKNGLAAAGIMQYSKKYINVNDKYKESYDSAA